MQKEGRFYLNKDGWLPHVEIRGQNPVQIYCDSVAATLLDGTIIQVT